MINGPVAGTRRRGPDYGGAEIGADLCRVVSELSRETSTLLQAASGAVASAASEDDLYQRAFLSATRATFLLTQWKAQRDESNAARALASGGVGVPAAVSFSPESQQRAANAPFQPLGHPALMGPTFQPGSAPRHAERRGSRVYEI